jgi:RNA polymerase sigma-70 factor (ECF subfamily)
MTNAAKRTVAPAVPSESALVERLAAGDLDALGKLFDRFEPDVRRFVQRLGVQTSDADDLVQLTFLDVAKSASRFDARCSARAWILGVAAIHVRRHRRSVARLLRAAAAHVFEARRPEGRTPDEMFDHEQSQARFRSALEKISDKKREVFVMVAMEGASGEEAAVAFGIPVATVWTRLHHARKELRAALSEREPGADTDADARDASPKREPRKSVSQTVGESEP